VRIPLETTSRYELAIAFVVCCAVIVAHCGLLPAQDRAAGKPEHPEKYTLDYPRAASFCPPMRTTFFEVSHTTGICKGRRFRQKTNGGYNPHLHFGVRKGRKVAQGMKLAEIVVNGERRPVTIVELGEDRIQIDLPASVPDGFALRVSNATIRLTKQGDKSYLPSRFLWSLPAADFQIIGYDLKTDDFLDPVAFLQQQRADSNPAPFRLAK